MLVDGQDLRTATQASVRAAMAVVPQDSVLFNDTLGYNIAYGCPGASEQQVRVAATAVWPGPALDAALL